MMKNPNNAVARSFLINLGLLFLSVLLFAVSFPNLLIENGIPFFAWIAYVPIFVLLQRISTPASVFLGALYGYAAYGLFNYWLGAFHPLAGFIVYTIYMVYNVALFFFLRLAIVFFPRRFYIAQWLIWLAYEYLCTKGFLGYPYGITGYSQWRMLPLIQIAGLCGVWGVSALVVFPSTFIAAVIGKRLRVSLFDKISAAVWAVALIAVLIYGFAVPSDFSSAPRANIALIQHNTDPWKGDIEQYRKNFAVLKRLSNEALAAQPKPDMVVWCETAFVPRIYWHRTYRDDQPSWLLVKDLLEYLDGQATPFVFGNDDAVKDPAKNPSFPEGFRVDYNAAMVYENGENTGIYHKLHLVPFTEHFPYGRQLPWLYRTLVNADTHFWEKGTEATVFAGPGFAFSTPICFEDTFGYLSRKFVQNGAELIVNLSNDAWSKSLPAQNQHLGMAVFRAVENRRSMVRATSSGQTCGIDPYGRVLAMAKPFTEAWIIAGVPIVKDTTAYTRYGDYLGVIFTAGAVFLLLFGGIVCIISKRRNI